MEYYTWILCLHIIAVLSWMAMLSYLPRLFVYHVENIDKKEFVEV
ncbi:CopD family protein, partial [Aliarcobacter butzleri]